MLKLTLKPGEFIQIGEEVKVVFSGGSANNIHLLVDAPRSMNIARSSAKSNRITSPYYKEKGISAEAQQKIIKILREERSRDSKGQR